MKKLFLLALLATQSLSTAAVHHYSICTYLPSKQMYYITSLHVDQFNKLAHMISFLSPSSVEAVPGKYEYFGLEGADVSLFYTERSIYTYSTGTPQSYGRVQIPAFNEILRKIFIDNNEYLKVFIKKHY